MQETISVILGAGAMVLAIAALIWDSNKKQN
jgi:hypothetical protein